MDSSTATSFGFRIYPLGEAWRWECYDPCGRVQARGAAPEKALAAAFVIRALAQASAIGGSALSDRQLPVGQA
jgi:hypothetical protein